MGAKILLVDDTKFMRKMGENALRAAGYEVATAVDGNDALAVLNAQADIGLILTDWHMPEMDGLALLQAVRRHERLQRLPVVMITSESDRSRINQALEAGATDYLIKPFPDYDVVVNMVRKIVG